MPPCQGGCREFEPRLPLHFNKRNWKSYQGAFFIAKLTKSHRTSLVREVAVVRTIVSYKCGWVLIVFEIIIGQKAQSTTSIFSIVSLSMLS
mgnify:CR=1 FL=1